SNPPVVTATYEHQMPPTKSPAQIERMLRQRLLRSYRELSPDPPERIILGFSGGGDSLSLALLFRGIARAIPSRIVLAHVDHRIRTESAADAKRARELASRLGMPFELLRTGGHPAASHPGVGLEEAARRERFRLLSSMYERGDVIALAHHAGDQVETMVLHLLRGAGLAGIAGMSAIDILDVPWWGDSLSSNPLPIWRPVIRESQTDLRSVLQGAQLVPIEDPSNDDIDLRRNEIRHVLIPVLKSIEPTYEERFSELAMIADEDIDLLDRYAADAFLSLQGEDGSLLSPDLVNLPLALGRRVVRKWLTLATGVVPSFDRVQALLTFAAVGDSSGTLEVGEGCVAGNFASKLRCGRKEDLIEQSWNESVLALPLATMEQTVTFVGDTIIVKSPNGRGGSASFSLPDQPTGALSLVKVDRREKRRGLKSDWGAWLREQRVSSWLREDVQGVAIDGVLRWIPRITDQAISETGRIVRVEVQPGE
ncbi:MAG: tRNA lysidine(34) synthetase TilS, partial [Thermomicrobiales bacterium]